MIESLENRQMLTTVYWAGGSGTWDTNIANKSWRFGSATGRPVAWSNSAGYDAVFADSKSTIAVGSTVDVNSLKFTGVGDMITGAHGLVLARMLSSSPAADTGTIAVAPGATATIAATIGGSGGLTLTGGGVLILSAPTGFAGATTVNAGTLDLTASQTATRNTTNARPLTINSGGTVIADAVGALTSALSTSPAVTINAGGTLVSGNGVAPRLRSLVLNGGTLASGTVDPSKGSWQFQSATISVTADSVVSATNMGGSVTLATTAGTTATVTGSFGGRSMGSAVVSKTGSGAVVLTGDNSSPIGPASFNVSAGTLQVGDGAVAGAVGETTIYDAALVTFDNPGTEILAGSITGPGAVQVAGGTLVLTTGSSYSGGTTVVDGTLVANNSTGSATGSGPVAVGAGATLSGDGSVAGPVMIRSGGVLSPGGSTDAATLGVGALTLAAGSTLEIQLTGDAVGASYDRVMVAGSATVNGATLSIAGVPAGAYLNGMDIVSTTTPVIGTFANLPAAGTLATGGMTFSADYRGRGGNDLVLTPVVPVPTTIAVKSSGIMTADGEDPVLSVTVQASAAVVPFGPVTLNDGPVVIAATTLDAAGAAVFSLSGLAAGNHSVTVVYSGNSTFAGSTTTQDVGIVTSTSATSAIYLGTTAASTSVIVLSWFSNAAAHSGYQVYRSSPGTPYSPIASVDGRTFTFTDRGLLQGVAYNYRVVAIDDGTGSNAASATTPLPAPAYQGPAVEPTYPAGFDTFTAPVSSTITAGTGSPAIDEFTRSAQPDDSIAVTAESLTNASLGAAAADGTGAGFVAYGQTTAGNGVLADGTIQTLDGRATSVTLPASLPADSVYFVWARNIDSTGTVQYSTPAVVNQPDLWWDDETTAIPGGTASVFGRNLTAATGATAGKSWVYLQSSTGTGQWITATATASGTDVNSYKVDFAVPASLAAGTYTVWVNNGLAGHYSWSNAIQLKISPTPIAVQTIALTTTDEAAIQAALYSVSTDNGKRIVDVSIPDGTVTLNTPLYIPGEVHLVGSGQTTLYVPPNAGLQDAVDLGQQGSAGLENLSIVADNGAISTTSSATDGRYPAVIEMGAIYQVLKNVTVSDVNPDARAAADVNASSPLTDARITGCSFTGPGMILVGGTDLVIDGCTFVGAGAGDAAIRLFYANGVTITRNTFENLSNDPSLYYSSTARVFWLGSSGGDIYLGQNNSVNLFPETPITSGLNGGEQILTESTFTSFQGNPISATSNTISLPRSTGLTGIGWSITVASGTGLGQTRVVSSTVDTGDAILVTLTEPWTVIPATTSTVAEERTTDRFVVFANHLSGDGVQSFRGSTTGVQLGGNDVIVDGNTITGEATGIALWSYSQWDGYSTSISDFAVITNNTVSNSLYGLRLVGASFIAGEAADVSLGNVWRNNTVSHIHSIGTIEDPASAISVSVSIPFMGASVTTNIFEHNNLTAPIGITFSPGGNQAYPAPADTVQTLVRGNTFTASGPGGTMGVFANATEPNFATLVGNTFVGYFYQYLTDGVTLSVPPTTRSVIMTVAPDASASASLQIQSTGATPVSWSLDTTSLPAWLTVPAASGITGIESAPLILPVTVNATGLPVGTYTTMLRLLVAGTETVDVMVYVDVVR